MTDNIIEKLFYSDFTEDYQKFAANSVYAEAYEKFSLAQEKFDDNPELSEYIQLAENLLDQTALHYLK